MGRFSEHNLEELFPAIAAGDITAFTSFFMLYRKKLFNLAFGITKCEQASEDICQSVFFCLWKKRESLANVDRPLFFIHRTVFNASMDVLRKQNNHDRYLQFRSFFASMDLQRNCPEEQLNERLLRSQVLKAAAELPHLKHKVFHLRFHGGLSYTEVAGALNITESSARSYFSHSIQFIRDYLRRKHIAGLADH